MRRFVIKFQRLSGGIAPRPPFWGGATVPVPRPYLPRLPRLARGLRPVHRPPNQKSWIHPWAHPPSENPGYACEFYIQILNVIFGMQ